MKLKSFNQFLLESLSSEEEIRLIEMGIHKPEAWFEIKVYEPTEEDSDRLSNMVARVSVMSPAKDLVVDFGFKSDSVAKLEIPINRDLTACIKGEIDFNEYLDRMQARFDTILSHTAFRYNGLSILKEVDLWKVRFLHFKNRLEWTPIKVVHDISPFIDKSQDVKAYTTKKYN